MQATATSSPQTAAVTAPAPPAMPVTVTFTGADGATQVLAIPMTREAIQTLRSQREELSNQLTSAAGRRNRLAKEIASTPPGPGRTGLEQRLEVLDQRMVQLESDIASTGRQLSSAPEGLIASSGGPVVVDIPENVTAVSVVFIIFVLFPVALSFARKIWRSSRKPGAAAELPANVDHRLERLEQGVDAIAIEIERVTEGQRFVTKLLSEQHTRDKLPASPG